MSRVLGLGRTEFLLFWRNRMAVFTALALPAVTVVLVGQVNLPADRNLPVRAFAMTAAIGFVLLYVVYYNLTAAYVARREELVLKRLRTGELADWQILTATALPAGAVALAQILLIIVAAPLLDVRIPVNPLLVAAGTVGGIAVFVLLAALSTRFTRTVEMAQLSTMPVMLACLIGSGLVVPLELLPAPVTTALRVLPMTPVVELVRLGWLGTTGEAPATGLGGTFAAAVAPALCMVAWLAFGLIAVRAWFRWDNRR